MKHNGSKLQLFVQGSIVLVVSNICIKAINFFLLPLYTRNLTPSMIGVSDSITTFTGVLLPLLVLGLDSAYSAFYFDKDDLKRDRKVFSTLGITFLLLGVIPLIMCMFSSRLSYFIFKTYDYSMEIRVALAGVSLNLWYLPFSLELRLKNKMGEFGITSIISSFSMVLFNVLFVTIMKMKEMSQVLSSAIVAGEQLALYSLFAKDWPQKNFFDCALLKKMFRFAIPLIPSVLMAWVLSLSDRYILLYYYGDSTVGLYGIGARFVNLLNVVINGIATAYTTFAFESKDDGDASVKYYYIFNIVSALLMLISFTISMFSKEIVAIMTDHAYYSSYVIIRDMMFGQVLYAMTTIVSYGIMFKKKSIYSLISVSVGAAINILLNMIFIPRYGLNAAAMTTLIGYLINLMVSYYFSEKFYPCNYGMKKTAITCVLAYFVAMMSLEIPVTFRIGLWVVCVIVGIIIYIDIIRIMIQFIKNIWIKVISNEKK